MRQSIDDRDTRRLLGGGPVVLISTAWRSNHNVMPAIFTTPVSIDPPLIAIAVHPSRHTHDMIKYSEEFALNIPTRELLHHVQYLGSVAGSELNKLELTGLPTFKARRIQAPLLEGCVGWIECGVQDAYRVGDHTLFIGVVHAVSADSDAFSETWTLTDPELKPLHYLGINFYGTLGDRLEARIPQPADIKRDVEAGAAQLGDDQESAERREREEQAEDEARRG